MPIEVDSDSVSWTGPGGRFGATVPRPLARFLGGKEAGIDGLISRARRVELVCGHARVHQGRGVTPSGHKGDLVKGKECTGWFEIDAAKQPS